MIVRVVVYVGKVVRLHDRHDSKQEELVGLIEHFLDLAKNGEITSFQVSANHIDGDVVTGYCNMSLSDKMVNVQYLQLDLNYEMVKTNLSELVDHL